MIGNVCVCVCAMEWFFSSMLAEFEFLYAVFSLRVGAVDWVYWDWIFFLLLMQNCERRIINWNEKEINSIEQDLDAILNLLYFLRLQAQFNFKILFNIESI